MSDIKQPNPQELKAIEHYIKHGVKIDAYRHAYDTTNMKDTTAQRNAARLFDRPHVQLYILQTQTRQAEQFDVEVHEIKKMLMGAASLGLKQKVDHMGNRIATNISGAVAALAEINRMNGNHAPSKRQLMGPGDGPIEVRTLNDFYSDMTGADHDEKPTTH